MEFYTKLVAILMLEVWVVGFAATCDNAMIEDCRNNLGLDTYGWPVLLNVPEAERDVFCERIPDFTTCLDAFRDDCTFEESENFWSYEDMGRFICVNLTSYEEHYEVINSTQYRDLWGLCFVTFASLDGSESREEGCGEIEKLSQCFLQVIENETEAARTYVEQFGNAALTNYIEHYGCTSGSSAIAITSCVTITSLLLLLWMNDVKSILY